jgi:haloacid dehalogenase-like hydrolase
MRRMPGDAVAARVVRAPQITEETRMPDRLKSWRATPAKTAITDFVAAVTDSGSDAFVPEVERIAVFDNDGTLSVENPYAQLAFALDRAAELGHPMTPDELKAGGLGKVLELLKLTHGSITTDEFAKVSRAWAATARHPRFDRPYTTTVYQPMLELLALLDANGFSCWIFSGGGADFMRAWAPDVFGIPPHRIIGSSGAITFQIGDEGPELLKGDDLAVLDDGPQKPISIHQSIGQRPILAAGNTDGDLPMLQWTAGNAHRSLELVVHHTDGDREFAYDTDPLLGSGTANVLAAAAKGEWTVIDMANDWETIYPPES